MTNIEEIKYQQKVNKVDCIFTFYWIFNHEHKEDWTEKDWDCPIRNEEGNIIEIVNGGIAERALMEGCALLPSGKIINLINHPIPVSDPRKSNAQFAVLDKNKYPFGHDTYRNPLEPWRTIASDPLRIPHGKKVYIPLFDGLEVIEPISQKKIIHDGYFIAQDCSWSFHGYWIDIFTGSYPAYIDIFNKIGNLAKTKEIKNAENVLQKQFYTTIFIL